MNDNVKSLFDQQSDTLARYPDDFVAQKPSRSYEVGRFIGAVYAIIGIGVGVTWPLWIVAAVVALTK